MDYTCRQCSYLSSWSSHCGHALAKLDTQPWDIRGNFCRTIDHLLLALAALSTSWIITSYHKLQQCQEIMARSPLVREKQVGVESCGHQSSFLLLLSSCLAEPAPCIFIKYIPGHKYPKLSFPTLQLITPHIIFRGRWQMHCKRTIAMSNEIEKVCIMQSQQTARKCTLHRAQHYIRYTDNTDWTAMLTNYSIMSIGLVLSYVHIVQYTRYIGTPCIPFNQHIIFHVIWAYLVMLPTHSEGLRLLNHGVLTFDCGCEWMNEALLFC